MARKMCTDCPFRAGSSTFHLRESWLKELAESRILLKEPDLPQGCHMLPDGQDDNAFQADPELQCAGHIRHMKLEARK